ncbi:XRN 5'-3' exonuclease N-terminus family protein [Trichomonas vaginalis G3]|uniref:XRN 5'-3' exonuclease N-terminus family protein n=1 Tax=Trichomonas vaginalis (strain ATCC PRA-98 / G3) TaxID=412133 RepID=A2EP68_TRIV3|nr:5'->3' exoribonuclease family [Trichomonas vaginalis G3]EAY05535.1 XRN 5'-3' exonuclease N-terminus family protein [Trichomonas vaginalis G3]KAI5549094.1 5'->3' exoribonuclease family [Trichomonas vaginalis G3]|eukprot:XP_001317758.1 XRN 5'-3' exonuclease N-terminus family protein [Trichomonas vaginalis G3]
MGVPGFYRWVTQRYPLVRRRMNDPARPKIDYFYIDFNCIIYNALRSISMSSGGTILQLFNEVCRYLDVLVQVIKPQIVLFISVDGPAPFAKCTQQRSRRFVAARDSVGAAFNTTAISVGTTFMEDLHQHLLEYFKRKVNSDRAWSTPQLIYSSHRTPGEGEHKFFNYIREIRKTADYDPNSTHCIYSPDADLIFLALQSKEKYIYIMREWDAWVGPNENVGNGKLAKLKTGADDFELLHLPILKEYLSYDFPGIPLSNLVDDFAGFSFLIGNDFIPHFPDVIIQHGDFDQVVIAYQKSLLETKQYLIVDGKFNKPALQIFLRSVVHQLKNKSKKQEKAEQDKQMQNYLKTARTYISEKYPEETKRDPEFEKKLSFSVLDSFDWVLEYYTEGCPSWTWCFQYFYAPPLIIVSEYVLEHSSHFELSRPPLPFEQLLCILPPQSANLLPSALSSLMFSPSPISSYYPTSFSIDLNGRAVEHEGVVLIPFVDVEKVRELVSSNLSKLGPNETERNTIIPSYIISSEGEVPFDVTFPRPKSTKSYCIPPGLPLFSNPPMPMSIIRTVVPVNIFQRPSQGESLLISVDCSRYEEFPPMGLSDFEDPGEVLGKVVLVNWPFLRPCLVCQVGDCAGALSISKDGSICAIPSLSTEFCNMIYKYKKDYALDVKQCKVILGVRLLCISNSGETRFTFANEITYVPFELCVPVSKTNTLERFFTTQNIESLREGMKVVVTCGEYSGNVGVIQQIKGDGVDVKIFKRIYPTSMKQEFEGSRDNWVSYDSVLQEFGVDPSLFHAALSSLPVSREKDLNVALTLFYDDKFLEGFVNYSGKTLQLSKEAKFIIAEYFKRSGKLLDFLRNYDDSRELKFVDKTDLFDGSPSEVDRKTRELVQWIREVSKTSKFYLVDNKYMTIEQSTLESLERLLIGSRIEDEEICEVTIPISSILSRGMQKSENQSAAISNRVICISECGSTPFGTFGSIVGLDRKKREAFVLSDEVLEFGTNMRKRLTTLRGFVEKIDDLWIIQ